MALLAILLLAGCAPEASPAPRASLVPSADQGPRGTLRIAWRLEPDNLSPSFATGSGTPEFFWVFNSYLTYRDFEGALRPLLALEIPTQENGDWVLNADGTMQTTYRLRPNARWQDTTPLTAGDYVFGFEVANDPEMPIINRQVISVMSDLQAVDDQTLLISWKRPYIFANALVYQDLNPLPRHLLESRYRTAKATFTQGEGWTSSYVGSGPFRVESWVPGSSLIARANRDWVLGAPKLDTLEIRFVSDASTLLAQVLAGEIDLTNSPAVGVPEALLARDQWVAKGDGYLKVWGTRLHYLELQYRDVPGRQAAIDDVRVRRAFTHAVDRPALADAVTSGLGSDAEAFMTPQDPLYAEVDRAIVKYPFDPARAGALLAEAGWQPAGGGAVQNVRGQTLDVEVAVTGRQQQEATILADNWKAVGINSSLAVIPAAREQDREYRASFRGGYVGERTVGPDNFYWTTREIPSAQTRFAELNRGGFSDSEVDRLFGVSVSSFDQDDRARATIGLHRRMADLAGYIPLMFPVEIILARRSVAGPIGNYGPQPGITWNVFEWQVSA